MLLFFCANEHYATHFVSFLNLPYSFNLTQTYRNYSIVFVGTRSVGVKMLAVADNAFLRMNGQKQTVIRSNLKR